MANPVSIQLFTPSESYLDSLEWLHERGNDEQLHRGLSQVLGRASQVRDIAQRNRLWFDAVHLLRHDWQRSLSPALLDPTAITKTRDWLLQAEHLPPELQLLTADVTSEMWPNFEAFKASPAGRYEVNFDDDNWLGQFNDWLDRYLPCLLLDLPADADAAERLIKQRIEWMVSKVAPHDNDPLDIRDTLEDRCFGYVRSRWAPTVAEPSGV